MSHNLLKLVLLSCLSFFMFSCSCSGDKEKDSDVVEENVEAGETDKAEASEESEDNTPTPRLFYSEPIQKESSFIVISKKNLNLSVYADVDGDTVLVVRYPVCLSKKQGQKEKSGDMKTPHSEPGEPFTISEIKDASTWCHDFGDGRGEILAYGAWFHRLKLNGDLADNRSIGIHGSTNNEWSIPGSKKKAPEGKTVGHDSEGCIRLGDDEICHLHDNYAFVGQKVFIKSEDQGALPFEKNIKNKGDKGKVIVFK